MPATAATTPAAVRAAFGGALTGRVLEIGPGNQPLPVPAADAVVYADRPAPGGRDRTWPELAGQPAGPPADLHLDLDTDGLAGVGDGEFDAVVASHIIEHLANPTRALAEIHRVLRPGGRLVLLVPDRGHSFDAGRDPTPLAHLLDEQRRAITQVDDDHIREFCAAIHRGPVIHPPEVRAWHDPYRLDDAMMALHRRRTIHAHCWSPEEFVTFVAGLAATGTAGWELVDLYLRDDLDPGLEVGDDEFGLVLRRPAAGAWMAPARRAADLLAAWAAAVLADPRRDPGRVVLLDRAMRRDLTPDMWPAGGSDDAEDPRTAVVAALAAHVGRLRADVAAARGRAEEASAGLAAATDELRALRAGGAYRAGRAVTAPVRAMRWLRSP
ncbi:MAG TPA: methyltransferase domain-containing protein [Acidimicrobiales bacterium]|nr:methyltransferase domain-containing protein [Acidimicrobiales bacterium]